MAFFGKPHFVFPFSNWGRCLIVLYIIAFSQRGGRFRSSSGVFPSSRVWNVHQDGSPRTSADERLKRKAVSMKWNRPTVHLHDNVYLTTTTRIDPSACSLTVLNIKWRFNVIDTSIEITKIIFKTTQTEMKSVFSYPSKAVFICPVPRYYI